MTLLSDGVYHKTLWSIHAFQLPELFVSFIIGGSVYANLANKLPGKILFSPRSTMFSVLSTYLKIKIFLFFNSFLKSLSIFKLEKYLFCNLI